ncbi:MAG: hypothetical protein ACRD2W_22470, partial [Acidimicrobiales bacterium]
AADETSGGGASKSYEVGIVAKLPWPEVLQADPHLRECVLRSVTIRKELDASDETSPGFVAPWAKPDSSARSVLDSRVRHYEDDVLVLVSVSADLEAAVLAGTGATDAAGFVEQEVGTHPASYPRRRLAAADVGGMLTAPLEQAIGEATRRKGAVRVLTQKNFVADRRIEVVAHACEVHPESVVELRRAVGSVAPEQADEILTGLASYLIGCAFGRWDVRIGRDPAAALPVADDPFAPVPVCPPGMLVDPDGLPAREAPAGYRLTLTSHRLLVDEPGHPADIVSAVEAGAGALVDDPGALIDDLTRLLGVADLRTYLCKRFFKDHLALYSKSRRKAPIYWPLTIPSRGWTVWLYAPALSREALYGAAAHTERRWNAAEAEMRRLESAQLQAGDDAPVARSLATRLDAARRLGEELRSLHKLLAAVAASGWQPDLDDGIVVCASPLADALLDWAKDPAETRARLRAGKLDWASAHRWREAL